MNGIIASLVVLALTLIVALPVLWAALRPGDRSFRMALAWGLALASGVTLLQSNVLAARVPSWVTAEAMRSDKNTEKACRELMPALKRYGVLLEDPRPGRLVVVEARWSQLPANFRDFAAQCAEMDGEPAEVVFGAGS